MEDVPVSFGEWVQQRRSDLDLTRNELALKVGCSPVTIKKIERDERKPSRQIAELLAVHLQLQPDLYDVFVKRARGQFVEPQSKPAAQAEEYRADPTPNRNLPEAAIKLIGREQERIQLTQLVQDPTKQLVSIVGTGGIGKSDLALHLAHQLAADFTNGVFWVDFTSHTERSYIVAAIAKAVNLSIKRETRQPEQQLFDWLKSKHCLLVFDNFDNLIDEAQILVDLLEHAPRASLLVTTRQRLNLQQEQIFPLEGLAVPHSAEEYRAGQFSAVDLFVAAARNTDPSFNLTQENLPGVIKICRLVAGMPLSIKLAAAWVDMLPPSEIAEEIQNSLDFLETNLVNFPERHKSIRAIFDASWEKLAESEKKIFGRLTIFQVGFSRRAARSVAGASLPVLARLVDRSLIRYDTARESYRLNGLLQQYGAEQLEKMESAEAQLDLRERHSVYYIEALAERANRIKGVGQQTAMEQISRDLNNVRTAWRWAIAQHKLDLIDMGMEPFANFLDFKGRYREGEKIFLDLLQQIKKWTETSQTDRLLLHAIAWLSVFEFALGKPAQAKRSLDKANDIIQKLENREEMVERERAFVYALSGHLELTRDPAAARPLFAQALASYRSLGMGWEQAATMTSLGSANRMLREFEDASGWFSKSLEIRQQIGDQIGAAETLATMSELSRHRGQFYEAMLSGQNSVDLARQIENDNVLAMALSELAMAFYYDGNFPKQHQALLESLMLYERLNQENKLSQAYFRLTMSNCALGQFETAQTNAQRGLNLARQTGNQSQIALLLFAHALVSLSMGSYDSTKQLLLDGLAAFPPTAEAADTNATKILIALAEYRIGNPTPAKGLLAQTLETAVMSQDCLSLTLNYGVTAVVLADQQETEQAIILWEMVKRLSPRLQQAVWLRRAYGDRLTEVEESLTAEQRVKIEEHLQRHNLWDEADNLISFIQEKGWF